VFEKRGADGRRYIVVNLLNLDPNECVAQKTGARPGDHKLLQVSDPCRFRLSLPAGLSAATASLIDPFSLDVSSLEIADNTIAVPPVKLWNSMIIELAAKPDAPLLSDLHGPPKTKGLLRKDLDIKRAPISRLDPEKPPEILLAEMDAPFPRRPDHFAEESEIAAADWTARNRILLGRRGTNAPPAESPAPASAVPIRNGIVDIAYARGAMDYFLRFHESFAVLPRLALNEHRLSGAQTSYYFAPPLDSEDLNRIDLYVFADVPLPALGAAAGTLAAAIKGGAAAFFTGGEYSFGKGGYRDSILEREIMPVLAVETVDTRHSRQPLPLEPGPDWNELGTTADFSCKPSFWCWNQVALREEPGVKIFLKSGNRPILVGRLIGRGRVACLLASHRGRSNPDRNELAFFDWKDWPGVAAAVMKWLVPEALSSGKTAAQNRDTAAISKLLDAMETDAIEHMVLDQDRDEGGPLDGIAGSRSRSADMDKAALKNFREVVGLLHGETDERASEILSRKIIFAANLSDQDRWRAIDIIARAPPKDLAMQARPALDSLDPSIRGAALQLLAAARSPDFPAFANNPVSDAQPRDRWYTAVALPLYQGPELYERACRIMEDLKMREEQVRQAYTKGAGFSMAAPQVPLLDADTLLERLGWLCYASRIAPDRWGAEMASEWAMTAQYADYVDRFIANTEHGMRYMVTQKQIAAARESIAQARIFQAFFFRMEALMRPQVEQLARAAPEAAARAARSCSFRAQALMWIDLLGRLSPSEARSALRGAAECPQEVLRCFAAARLAAFR